MASSNDVSVVHPTGNQNVRMALAALHEAGRLRSFATSIGVASSTAIPRWLPRRIREELEKRTYEIPGSSIQQRRREEVARNLMLRVPVRSVRRAAEPWARFGVDRVARAVDSTFARSLKDTHVPSAILGYQGTSLESFRAALDIGVGRWTEVTHVHWRATARVYEESMTRDPEWASTIAVPDSGGQSRADEQLSLSQIILSPSRQVSASILAEFPDAEVVENPYGCPPIDPGTRARDWDGQGKLRALFVGRLTAGKGLAALASAVERLDRHVEFTLIGVKPNVRSAALDRLVSSTRYLGPVPRERVMREMSRAHVFILPSLVEGRSLAALEALSKALPSVVTPGTGVDDLVEQGAGSVVPVGDNESFVNAIESLVAQPYEIARYSESALKIAQHNSWAQYQSVIANLSLRQG